MIELVDRCTVELIKTNANDEDVAFAAWVSNFASEARNRPLERIGGLINFLYREGHTSPLEHGSFTFFVDSPIFVSREWLRHRTWSYNETSSRYKELEPRFYVPPRERPLVQTGKVGAYTFTSGDSHQHFVSAKTQEQAYKSAWKLYQAQLKAGVAREVARNVLPLATMTQFYATANPLNVIRFLLLRNEAQALYEIRQCAEQVERYFEEAMPLTYAAFDNQRTTWQKLKRLLELYDIDELLEKK